MTVCKRFARLPRPASWTDLSLELSSAQPPALPPSVRRLLHLVFKISGKRPHLQSLLPSSRLPMTACFFKKSLQSFLFSPKASMLWVKVLQGGRENPVRRSSLDRPKGYPVPHCQDGLCSTQRFFFGGHCTLPTSW